MPLSDRPDPRLPAPAGGRVGDPQDDRADDPDDDRFGEDGARPEFEDFYDAHRRSLTLAVFAVVGDRDLARDLLERAFLTAAQRWRRVSREASPAGWVLDRACAGRADSPWPPAPPEVATEEQRETLAWLGGLGADQRRDAVLPLVTPPSGPTSEPSAEPSSEPTSGADAHPVAPEVTRRVTRLEPLTAHVSLPRAPSVARRGRRRRRARTGLVLVVAVVVLLGAAGLVRGLGSPSSPAAESADEADEVTPAMLIDEAQAATVVPGQAWRVASTTDNTTGDGRQSLCQTARFADRKGVSTLVRTFTAAAGPGSGAGSDAGSGTAPAARAGVSRRLVQTVDVSGSRAGAEAAYRTTLGWFAGCDAARLQLLNAYRVPGLGDEARMLRLRIPDRVPHSYLVGVVRTGSLTLSNLLETRGAPSGAVGAMADSLTDAVRNLCPSRPSGVCRVQPRVVPVAPPPSGEARGMLAVADLPSVGDVRRPWVGTAARTAPTNLSATTCDQASFVGAGGRAPRTRTFLIPGARVPARFGLTETQGDFPTAPAAQRFFSGVVTKMAGCEKKDLSASVSQTAVVERGYRGSRIGLWRLDSEIRKDVTVGYWMGVVQAGDQAAQVLLTPAPGADVDADTFRALLDRTRDRLFELS